MTRKDTKSALERLFRLVSGHPFLSVSAMCVLLFFFGFCERNSFTSGSYLYGGAVLIALSYGLILLGRISP